jgi:hypothetical protein
VKQFKLVIIKVPQSSKTQREFIQDEFPGAGSMSSPNYYDYYYYDYYVRRLRSRVESEVNTRILYQSTEDFTMPILYYASYMFILPRLCGFLLSGWDF